MLLTILALLCGIVLSFRFEVLILLPATLLGWLLAVIGGIVMGSTGTSIAFGMVMTTAALQGGYVLGIAGQWALRSQRALPQRRSEKTTAVPDSAF